MKKILCFIFTAFLIGCSSTPYEDLTRKGYGVSKADNRFLSKKGEESSYYRYNDKNAGLFLIIEKNEITEEVNALLNLEYQGKDWLYMEKVHFIGDSKSLEIDFLSSKFSGAISQEIPKASGSVKERILIPLSEDQVDVLEGVIKDSAEINIIYSSRYRNGKSKTSLSPEERVGLQTMIKLYNKVKGEKINGN